jgi:hypothetical protein
VVKAEVNGALQVVEEFDTLANQLDLLDVIELKPKRTGCDRRRERRKRRALFEDQGPKSGTLREEGSGAADDAAADDDEVGAVGR